MTDRDALRGKVYAAFDGASPTIDLLVDVALEFAAAEVENVELTLGSTVQDQVKARAAELRAMKFAPEGPK